MSDLKKESGTIAKKGKGAKSVGQIKMESGEGRREYQLTSILVMNNVHHH